MDPLNPLHRKLPRSGHPDQEQQKEEEIKRALSEILKFERGPAAKSMEKTVSNALAKNPALKEPFLELLNDYEANDLQTYFDKIIDFHEAGVFLGEASDVESQQILENLKTITDQLIAKKLTDEIQDFNAHGLIPHASVEEFQKLVVENDKMREITISFLLDCLKNPHSSPVELQEKRNSFNEAVRHYGMEKQTSIKEIADLFQFHPSRTLPKFAVGLRPEGFYSLKQLKNLPHKDLSRELDQNSDRVFSVKHKNMTPPQDLTETLLKDEGYYRPSKAKGFWKKERVSFGSVRIGHYFPNRSCIEREILIPKPFEEELIAYMNGEIENLSDTAREVYQEINQTFFTLARDALQGNPAAGSYKDVTKKMKKHLNQTLAERINAIDPEINVRYEVRTEAILQDPELSNKFQEFLNLCTRARRSNQWAVDHDVQNLNRLDQNKKLKAYVESLKKSDSIRGFEKLIDRLYNAAYLKFAEEAGTAEEVETEISVSELERQPKRESALVLETKRLLGAKPLPEYAEEVIEKFSDSGVTVKYGWRSYSFSDFFSDLLSLIETNVEYLKEGQWKKYKAKELTERFESLRSIPRKYKGFKASLTEAEKNGFEKLYSILKNLGGVLNRTIFKEMLTPEEGPSISKKAYEGLSFQEQVVYDQGFRVDSSDGIWKRVVQEENKIHVDYALPKTRPGYILRDELGRESREVLVAKRATIDLDLQVSGISRKAALEYLAAYCGQDSKTKTARKTESIYSADQISSLSRTAKILEDQTWKKLFTLNLSLQDPKGDYGTKDISDAFSVPIYDKFLIECREKLKYPFPDFPQLREAIQSEPVLVYSLDDIVKMMVEVREMQLSGAPPEEIEAKLAKLTGIWFDFYANYEEYQDDDLHSIISAELILQFVGMGNTQNLTDNFVFANYTSKRIVESEPVILGASKATRHVNMPERRRSIRTDWNAFEKALHFRNYKKIQDRPSSQIWQYHNWVMEEGTTFSDGAKKFLNGYCTIGFAMPAYEQVLETNIPIDLTAMGEMSWRENREVLRFIQSYLDQKPREKSRPLDARRAEYQNSSPFPPNDERTDILLEIAEQVEQDVNRLYSLPMLYLGREEIPDEVRDVSEAVKGQAKVFEPLDRLTKECFSEDFLKLFGKYLYAAYEKEGFVKFYSFLLDKYRTEKFLNEEEIDQLVRFLDLGKEEKAFRHTIKEQQNLIVQEREVLSADFLERYGTILHSALEKEGFREVYIHMLDRFVEGEPVKAARDLKELLQFLDLDDKEKEAFQTAFDAEIERYM